MLHSQFIRTRYKRCIVDETAVNIRLKYLILCGSFHNFVRGERTVSCGRIRTSAPVYGKVLYIQAVRQFDVLKRYQTCIFDCERIIQTVAGACIFNTCMIDVFYKHKVCDRYGCIYRLRRIDRNHFSVVVCYFYTILIRNPVTNRTVFVYIKFSPVIQYHIVSDLYIDRKVIAPLGLPRIFGSPYYRLTVARCVPCTIVVRISLINVCDGSCGV